MDFFEAQDKAKSRSKLLFFYFGVAVVLIVMAVYAAVTGGVFYYHHQIESSAEIELIDPDRLITTTVIVVVLIAIGSFVRIMELRRKGGEGVATALGGRRILASTQLPDERQLMNVVEEMAIASGVPIPAVFIMEMETGVNAFAAGFTLEDSAIGVTRGAVEQLNRDELQGVIAHEFSHILNGDMRISTQLSGWIFGIVMLTVLGRGFWAILRHGSGSRVRGGGSFRVGGGGGSRRSGNGGGAGALIIAILLVAVLITIIGFIGEFFARLIQAAVSRQREYLADAAAVQFTRNPEGIGNALRRIGGMPQRSLMHHPNASEFAHAFFSKSLASEVSFLATHPPLKHRIERILKDWKGEYISPRPRPEQKQKEREIAKKQAVFPAGLPGNDRGDEFQKMLTAGLFVTSLGQLREQGQTYAASTRATLSAAFPQAFARPAESLLVVLALLYQKDEAVAPRQGQLLGEFYPNSTLQVSAYSDQVRLLDRAERLVLLELMTTRLTEALQAHSDREEFIACAKALAEADQNISTFELASLRLIERRLHGERITGGTKPSPSDTIKAASIVATRLAQETQLPNLSIGSLLNQASKLTIYFTNQLRPASSATLQDIDQALTILSRTPLGIRRQFLQLCERIIAADETATLSEVELLRAIAASLGLPATPIFPEFTTN